MGMPVGTFKNKLSDTQIAYSFTEAETDKLKSILMDMAADVQELAGISFNDALKEISKNK
jgi:chromosome condensin MukBEF ATPase and DNA-binding subunit MukB